MPIFTQFTPNIQIKELALSLFYLTPLGWPFLLYGWNNKKLKSKIENEFNAKTVTFDSGRTALYAILKSLDKDDRIEIIMQSYTCVVVANSIKKAGYKPVYVDTVKNGVNMDPQDLKSKINKNTKAVIIQHTFGFPDKIREIQKICHAHKVFLIEDLAHSLTGEYKGKRLGKFGDASFISFGSAKIISSGRGGAAFTQHQPLYKKIKRLHKRLHHYSPIRVLAYHLKHWIFTIFKPIFFTANLGKAALFLLKKLGTIPGFLNKNEKEGDIKKIHTHKMPDSLAALALSQWSKKEKFHKHRLKIAKIYQNNLSDKVKKLPYDINSAYLLFPIFVDNSKELFSYMKKNHIILGVWYDTVIAPKDIDLSATKYKHGTCRHAEEMTQKSLNLPTHIHISTAKAKKITNLINKFYE